MSDGTIIITGEKNINMARLLTLKHALRLEILGLKNSRWSIYALVKKEFGFKGNKKSVLTQLIAHIEELKKG